MERSTPLTAVAAPQADRPDDPRPGCHSQQGHALRPVRRQISIVTRAAHQRQTCPSPGRSVICPSSARPPDVQTTCSKPNDHRLGRSHTGPLTHWAAHTAAHTPPLTHWAAHTLGTTGLHLVGEAGRHRLLSLLVTPAKFTASASVQWSVAGQIAVAWLLTMPAAAAVGAVSAWVASTGPVGTIDTSRHHPRAAASGCRC